MGNESEGRGTLFTEKILALERGKGKYIGEAKDGFQEEHKKNKTQTKYGSEGGGGSRNTKEKTKGKTHLEEPRQKNWIQAKNSRRM